jgi:hypothetical protein
VNELIKEELIDNEVDGMLDDIYTHMDNKVVSDTELVNKVRQSLMKQPEVLNK